MNCNVRKTKKIAALVVLSVLVVALGIPIVFSYAQSPAASDIEGHWASKEISSWVEQGLVKGYPNGTFRPDNSITRAEFAALVNRTFEFEEMAAISFSDVNQTDWYYVEIAKANRAGYLVGYKDGTVRPKAYVTRQEVATMIARLKSLEEDASEASSFADSASIPEWSKGFIGAVVKAKYMKGYPNGYFRPAENITRAESVVALNNLLAVEIESISEQSIEVNASTKINVKTAPADAVISIQNSDDKVIRAVLSSAVIELKGLKEGNATITVTAQKEGLLNGVTTFNVEVKKAIVLISGGGGYIPQNNKPVITVVEPDEVNDGIITLTVGAEFVAPTVTASDAEDGDITDRIVKTGEDDVDTSEIGEYILTYNVKDSRNLAADERKVIVKVVEADENNASANITVDVAEAMDVFKRITVNSSTVGAKFKVEGSTLVKAFGESIDTMTSEASVEVSILDEDENVLGTITVDVSSDSTADYGFTAQIVEPVETVNITVDVAEAMPMFKSITVNSSTVGTRFKVEGSTLDKQFGEPIVVNTSEDTVEVSILDEDDSVVGTVTVEVGSDGTTDYEF